jgi:hypothetical protein
MNEKVLMAIGVVIFSVTVLGVLWYFYILLAGISPIAPLPDAIEVSPDASEGNA